MFDKYGFEFVPCRYKGDFPANRTDQYLGVVTREDGKTLEERFWVWKGTPEDGLRTIFLSQLAHRLPDPETQEEYGDWEDDLDVARQCRALTEAELLRDRVEEFFGVGCEEFMSEAIMLRERFERENTPRP